MSNHENLKLRKEGTVELFVEMLAPKPPDHSTLFVAIHGLVCLIDGKDEFRAYPLSMPPVHSYLLGDWLGELPMPEAFRAELKGVVSAPKSSANRLDASKVPVVAVAAFPSEDSLPASVLGVIRLPRPTRLHFLNRGNASFTNNTSLKDQNVTGTAGLVVFEYESPESLGECVLLDESTGQAAWRAANATAFDSANEIQVATLHIISQPGPQAVVPAEHPKDEFNLSATFLGFPNVSLVAPPVDFAAQPEPPRGMSSFETEPYESRRVLNQRLCNFLRTGRWTSSMPLSGDCRSCCTPLYGEVDQ